MGGLLLGAAVALAVTGCSSSSKGSSAPTAAPGPLLTTTTADAQAQQWAHVVVTGHQGAKTGTITQEAGPGQGEQDIDQGEVVANVVWVDGTAYIRGNSQAVTGYFGFPAPDGSSLAEQWISIPPSSSEYVTVTDGVSLSSTLQETGLSGRLTTTARTTRAGRAVIGIQGTASQDVGGGAATLYVTTTAHPLPVELDTTSSQGTEQVVFSAWGKPASLSAPSGARPISSITPPSATQS